MGHKHYAVNNDTLITFPRGTTHQVGTLPIYSTAYWLTAFLKGVHYTNGFHGEAIPVYGPAVADMIRLRLRQPLSDVED